MVISSKFGEVRCLTLAECEAQLKMALFTALGNEIWCYRQEGQDFPCLSILVKDTSAVVNYFSEANRDMFASLGELSREGIACGENGWLMYLREEGDAGFSSRNPDYAGPEEATMGFPLSNGQCDEYPMAWVLPVDQVYAAIEYFKTHHKPPAFIVWHNDSNDGVSLNEETSNNR